jgi:hypothetical protein
VIVSERTRGQGSDRQRRHPIHPERRICRGNTVPGSECLGESLLHTSCDRVWAGTSYPAQVLSLKPQSAALYLHAVSSYLPLYNLGQQQAAKDFKVEVTHARPGRSVSSCRQGHKPAYLHCGLTAHWSPNRGTTSLTWPYVDLDVNPPYIMVWRSVRAGGEIKRRNPVAS